MTRTVTVPEVDSTLTIDRQLWRVTHVAPFEFAGATMPTDSTI